jgi:hypothetical protein
MQLVAPRRPPPPPPWAGQALRATGAVLPVLSSVHIKSVVLCMYVQVSQQYLLSSGCRVHQVGRFVTSVLYFRLHLSPIFQAVFPCWFTIR